MFQRILATCLVAAMICLGCLSIGSDSTVLATQGTPCAPNSNDEIAVIVDQFNAAIDQQDSAAIGTLFSTDVSRDLVRGQGVGVDSIVAAFDEIFAAFPDKVETTNLILVDAPFAMVHYTSTGTQATTFAGEEPIGQPVSWDAMYMIEVECGKIVQVWNEVDRLARVAESDSTPATPVAPASVASPESCPELTRETAQSLMDSWYHEIWTGNLDLLATLTTPGVYHHWAQGPDSSGQDAQMAHLQATLDMLPGLTSGYDQLIVSGDLIGVRWEQSLGDDTWGGMNIFRTECGRIAEVWSEMNITELPALDGSATPTA
jgi:predicted ester cyclase